MSTDTGSNLLEPGATPHENHHFLFFCAAVIQAVNRHQALLRASMASTGEDHRPGATMPAGDHLDLPRRRAGEGLRRARVRTTRRPRSPSSSSAPRRAAAAEARRRPQPDLAVRVHRQQVRVPRTRLQPVAGAAQHGAEHDRGRGDRRARRQPEARRHRRGRGARGRADAYATNKRIVFDGDNYSEEWHEEAEQRGLYNLKQTPDALPWLINEQTVEVFSRYDVLSERELEQRLVARAPPGAGACAPCRPPSPPRC